MSQVGVYMLVPSDLVHLLSVPPVSVTVWSINAMVTLWVSFLA